jgi:hypothetical protein
LIRRAEVNAAAVLGAHVIALTVGRGGVVLTKKQFKKPPSAVDINRVLEFIANSTAENEKLNGGKWLNKFYEYRDNYGEREPSQRSRKAIEVKFYSILLKETSQSAIRLQKLV